MSDVLYKMSIRSWHIQANLDSFVQNVREGFCRPAQEIQIVFVKLILNYNTFLEKDIVTLFMSMLRL